MYYNLDLKINLYIKTNAGRYYWWKMLEIFYFGCLTWVIDFHNTKLNYEMCQTKYVINIWLAFLLTDMHHTHAKQFFIVFAVTISPPVTRRFNSSGKAGSTCVKFGWPVAPRRWRSAGPTIGTGSWRCRLPLGTMVFSSRRTTTRVSWSVQTVLSWPVRLLDRRCKTPCGSRSSTTIHTSRPPPSWRSIRRSTATTLNSSKCRI